MDNIYVNSRKEMDGGKCHVFHERTIDILGPKLQNLLFLLFLCDPWSLLGPLQTYNGVPLWIALPKK